jgi:hypothetical protein
MEGSLGACDLVARFGTEAKDDAGARLGSYAEGGPALAGLLRRAARAARSSSVRKAFEVVRYDAEEVGGRGEGGGGRLDDLHRGAAVGLDEDGMDGGARGREVADGLSWRLR